MRSTAVVQLLAGASATNSRAEDAARRIADLVHNKVQVGASAAARQFAGPAASVAYAQAVEASAVEETAATEASTAAGAGAPVPAPWQAEGAPEIGNAFSQMIAAKMVYQDSIDSFIASDRGGGG